MTPFIIAGALGPKEILLIVIALILLFGGKKIPELMRGIGEGIKEFKKASKADDNTSDKDAKNTENKG